MGRWSYLDTDEERLPEGMSRVGYDADTQVYTYRDSDGSYWEGAPGVQYGKLHRVRSSAPPLPSVHIAADDLSDDDDNEQPYVLHDYDDDSSDFDDDDDTTLNEKREDDDDDDDGHMLPTSPDKAILHPHHHPTHAAALAGNLKTLPHLPTDSDAVSTGGSSIDSLEKHSTQYGQHTGKETTGLKRAGTLSRLARFLSSSASSAGAARTLPRRATVHQGEGAAAAAAAAAVDSVGQRQGKEARRAGYAAGGGGSGSGEKKRQQQWPGHGAAGTAAAAAAAAGGTRGPATRKKRATTFDEILGVGQ